MNALQKLQLEQSKVREDIGVLLDKPERSDEDREALTTLTKRAGELEVELRAAITAESLEPNPKETRTETETREERELRELHDGSNVGDIFTAALSHGLTDGQTAELQQHYGLKSNQIPLELFALDSFQERDTEERAVTPAPGNVHQGQQAIIPDVFPASVSAFLGIARPRVPVGEAVFPVLTTGATVRTPAKDAAAAETTGAFSSDVLAPKRLQAAFFYNREDAASFRGLDSALRQNLNEALGDALDKQALSGTNGLLTGTVLANHNAAAVTTYANYISQFSFGRVDGQFAVNTGALRIVMGSGSYGHAGSVYRNNSVDRTALDRLMQLVGGVRVSAHVPGVSANKQNAVIRRGMNRDMVVPIWQGVTIIPDQVTLADKGQIKVTAVMLHAVKVLRSDGFYKQQTQHA